MNADMSDTSWSLCRRARARALGRVSQRVRSPPRVRARASSVNTGEAAFPGRACADAAARAAANRKGAFASLRRAERNGGDRVIRLVRGEAFVVAPVGRGHEPVRLIRYRAAENAETPFSSEETRAGPAVAPSSATKSTSSSGDFARGVSDERKPRVKKVVAAVASSPSFRF